jgi:hypothetical protein
MKRFYCGYKVIDYAFYPPPPYRGKGWHISFEEDETPSGRSSQAKINGKDYVAQMVVINASSVDRAKHAAELLNASICLMRGQPPFWDPTKVTPLPFDSQNPFKVPEDPDIDLSDGLVSVELRGLPLALMIAAKSSHTRVYQYALFKYLLSHEIFSTSMMDLDPMYWGPGQFVSPSARHHVLCAYAIVTAYSVLEELSFELRASPENPSSINGKWNPAVRADLEHRLGQAGIDMSELLVWTRRDTPTKIERARSPHIQAKAEWANIKIRDGEIELADAIAHASWLRSKVSAHSLRGLSESLNYYEVANVQHLARRLLLEKMGFW